MSENKTEELQKIRKRMLTLNMINMLSAIFIGFGLDGAFNASSGSAIISIFNNTSVAYSSIGAGLAIMFAVLIKMLPLIKRKFELENDES